MKSGMAGMKKIENHHADFWKTKSLSEMTGEEWELLCDHCGRCCLHKLEDEDSGEIFFTSVACKVYDLEHGQCSNYAHRKRVVPECVVLTAQNMIEMPSLPLSCAYRLLAEGKKLPTWHHLESGERHSVVRAGMSITLFALSENAVDMQSLEDCVLDSRI